jgi:hypothetical protein
VAVCAALLVLYRKPSSQRNEASHNEPAVAGQLVRVSGKVTTENRGAIDVRNVTQNLSRSDYERIEAELTGVDSGVGSLAPKCVSRDYLEFQLIKKESCSRNLFVSGKNL